LLSTVSDDSGEVSVVEQIRLGGKIVATVRSNGFISASSAKTVAVVWKVPSNAKGGYQHCVRAIDRSRNSSPISCARVVVR
jgi:hypothetical protein